MSRDRQTQWTQRITRLQALRDSFTSRCSYDRAYKAHLAIQHVYDRWASEMFAVAR